MGHAPRAAARAFALLSRLPYYRIPGTRGCWGGFPFRAVRLSANLVRLATDRAYRVRVFFLGNISMGVCVRLVSGIESSAFFLLVVSRCVCTREIPFLCSVALLGGTFDPSSVLSVFVVVFF